MEQIIDNLPMVVRPAIIPRETERTDSTSKPFVEANTEECSFKDLSENHIIPVFVKDNETLISHTDFIESASELAADIFHGERILRPNIRVSHPIGNYAYRAPT